MMKAEPSVEPSIEKALELLREAHIYWQQMNGALPFELWLCMYAEKERNHLRQMAKSKQENK